MNALENRVEAVAQALGSAPVPSALPGTLDSALWMVAAFALFFGPHLNGAEPDPNDPATELASFRLAEGFEANLFASERDGVVKPIQIRWDTRGRLWVIQSTTYPQLRPGEEPNDKVLILEDTDGDGRSDKTTVFADGLMIPTGLEIAPVDGGINRPSACYVGEGTKLWLLSDTDGDGKCDQREVVLRGFGTGDNHQNINSFRWSPGGELFFSQGLHAHSRVETPHGIVKLDHAGFFRFRPREHRLDAFYGGHADPQNPWGFVWTDWGQMLMVAGNNGGIFWPLPEMIRGVQNGQRGNIWVNARGRKTSGPDIVGTAHFPPEWQGAFITGGYINNAVWAMDIADDGAGFKLTDRPPLLTSTHTAFRPVDVKFGPDGALYVCDWFNPIIGHYQASFRHPDRDKTHGRIWRITAKGRPLIKPPPIAGAPVEALLENLKSPERYVREQSKRELAGRSDDEVAKALHAWVLAQDRRASANLHPLYELLGVLESRLSAEAVRAATAIEGFLLSAENAQARAYAVGALARLENSRNLNSNSRELARAKHSLAASMNDPYPRVQTAAVVVAGNWNDADSLALVLEQPPGEDRSLRLATRSALAALQPHLEGLVDSGIPGTEQTWQQRFALLRGASEAKKPTATLAPAKPAALPATGQLRATPEFVAALVAEVRASGDAKRGAEVFRRAELACVTCHSIEDKGGKIGPPLDSIGSGQPLDFIIGATLEPQREIKESYEAMQMTAKDGRVAVGYIAQRTAEGTTLRDATTGAETHFAAAEIAEFKPIGSLMPAGLVDRLSREDLRDLCRYLSELGKPR